MSSGGNEKAVGSISVQDTSWQLWNYCGFGFQLIYKHWESSTHGSGRIKEEALPSMIVKAHRGPSQEIKHSIFWLGLGPRNNNGLNTIGEDFRGRQFRFKGLIWWRHNVQDSGSFHLSAVSSLSVWVPSPKSRHYLRWSPSKHEAGRRGRGMEKWQNQNAMQLLGDLQNSLEDRSQEQWPKSRLSLSFNLGHFCKDRSHLATI